MNKKQQLDDLTKQIEQLIAQGFEIETEEKVNELFATQMELLKTLSVNNPEERQWLQEIMETNNDLLEEIKKKTAEIVDQVTKMSTSLENKKNYDLYR